MEDVLRSRIRAWLTRCVEDQGLQEYQSIAATVGTSRGSVRGENQDRAIIVRFTPKRLSQAFLLFSLCDGLGGMQDGEDCACLALAELISVLVHNHGMDPKALLIRAVSSANDLLAERYQGRGGTTLSAVLVAPNGRAWGANVGDSRIYRYMPRLECEQISVDDTIAGQVQHIRGVRSEELDRAHLSDDLAQFVGIGKELESHSLDINLASPDVHFLLTSDGAHRPLSTALAAFAIHAPSPHDLVRRILYFSKCTGGLDNASVVAFRPLAQDEWFVRPHSPNLIELWDAHSKFEVLLPPNEGSQNNKLESKDRNKVRDTMPVTKRKRTRKQRVKEAQQQRKGSNDAGPEDGSSQQSQLDISVYYEDEDRAKREED